jgi:hypothetical protein
MKCSILDYFFAQSVSESLYFGLGPLAQSVEQRTFNPWVVGSIPTGPTQVLLSANTNKVCGLAYGSASSFVYFGFALRIELISQVKSLVKFMGLQCF